MPPPLRQLFPAGPHARPRSERDHCPSPGGTRGPGRRREVVTGRAGVRAVTGEHYEGGHWLGTFAVYLVTGRGLSPRAAGPSPRPLPPEEGPRALNLSA